MDLRCSLANLDEPLAGTAPSDSEWLFVEHVGAWGRDAAKELGVAAPGVRVQLVRRHGGRRSSPDGLRVFAASLGGPAGTPVAVRTALVPDLGALSGPVAWEPYADPLLLVCTHGRRDRCCAESGRPVAAALTARWPEATWETTHLGGHRFAGTLLALPSGYALGRLGGDDAVAAAAALLEGEVPLDVTRGRAGRPGPVQAAELHARRELGLAAVDDVAVASVEGAQHEDVVLRVPGGAARARVVTSTGEPRRQSCADDKVKPAPTYAVSWVAPPPRSA